MTDFNFEMALSLYNSTDPFPIDFDYGWQWLDFSRKSSAKRNFESCGFVEGVDFVVIHQKVEDGSKFGGWKTIEKIQMTIDCFKSWAMMVGTSKGKEVRTYFLKCEKSLKEKQQPDSTEMEQGVLPLSVAVGGEELRPTKKIDRR